MLGFWILKHIVRILKNRLFITVFLLSLSLYIFHLANVNSDNNLHRRKRSKGHQKTNDEDSSKSLNFIRESKPTCVLPKLSPVGYTIVHEKVLAHLGEDSVIYKPKTHLEKCQHNNFSSRHYNTTYKVTRDLTGKIVVSTKGSLTGDANLTRHCCYSVWERDARNPQLLSKQGSCTRLKKPRTAVNSEFVSVKCGSFRSTTKKRTTNSNDSSKNGNDVNSRESDQILFHIPLKSFVESRVRKAEKKIGQSLLESRMKVQIFGIDHLSRLNFHRVLPRSAEFLEKKLNAIEFLGHSTIGNGTLENIIPILTGSSLKKVQENCGTDKSCKLIWKQFSKIGYRIGFAEDAQIQSSKAGNSGSKAPGIFNVLRRMAAFKKYPPDYILPLHTRPSSPLNSSTNTSGEDPTSSSTPSSDSQHCGDLRAMSSFFKNMVRFATAFNDSGQMYFQFSWSSSLTRNPGKFLPSLDHLLLETLNSLHTTKVLSNTWLILMSSQGGSTYGPLFNVSLSQSSMEERMPALFLVPPSFFRTKYKTALDNLYRNTRHLTSHWDLYETLRDLTDLREVSSAAISRRISDGQNSPKKRGVSLFLPVSPERSCASAGVPSDKCVCLARKKDFSLLKSNRDKVIVSKDKKSFNSTKQGKFSGSVIKFAKDVVDELNRRLSINSPLCSPLELVSVLQVRKVGGREPQEKSTSGEGPPTKAKGDKSKKSQNSSLSLDNSTMQVIKLETSPGNGIFEAIVSIVNGNQTLTNNFRAIVKHVEVFKFTNSTSHHGCDNYDKKIRPFCFCLPEKNNPQRFKDEDKKS